MIAALKASPLDIGIAVAVVVVLVVLAHAIGSRRGIRSLKQRLVALGDRLGADPLPDDPGRVEDTLVYVERGTDRAAEAVAEASADAIRLRRALDALPQAVIVCDERGEPVFRNARP